MGTLITCEIDFSAADRPRSIKMLVTRLAPSVEASKSDRISIDLSKCQYLGPDAAAILGAVILDLRQTEIQVDVVPPISPPRLRTFFHFSGLESISKNGVVDTELAQGEGQSILPLEQLRNARFQDADPIIHMLRYHGTLDPELRESLRVCVTEVIQNIQDHAESAIGGLMAARFMEKDREVRVAIVDKGQGICTTLKKRYPDTTPDNVMARVLKGNYTTLSRINNLGLGVSNLADIIRRQRGSLFIMSEISTLGIARDGTNSLRRLPNKFGGTGVFFTLPVES